MNRNVKFALFLLVGIGLLVVGTLFVCSLDIAVLNPKGIVAWKQRELLTVITLLMLIVVLPVLIFTLPLAWKYRADNLKTKYKPDWNNSNLAELIWWGIPFVIVVVIGIYTWKSCVELDPYKPLESNVKPLTVQVVALEWKWLFIYPEQKIATVNYLQFPEKRPIQFEITADAPMNSFWIPQLGGQIYAMAGMKTKLHLIADEKGTFDGSSANLSGRGFAGMRFIAKAISEDDFNAWAESIRQSSTGLDLGEYTQLAKPSVNNSAASYSLQKEDLFEYTIMKYMMPMGN